MPLPGKVGYLQIARALHHVAQLGAERAALVDRNDAAVLDDELRPVHGRDVVGRARHDTAAILLRRMEHPRPARDVAGQVGLAEVLVAGPGGGGEVRIVELAPAVVVLGVVGERQVGALRVGDADALGRAHAVPGPAVDGVQDLDRHGMRGRGQDLGRDERHALDLDQTLRQHRAAVAHQDLVELGLLLLLLPHVHPFRELLGAEQVVVDLVGAHPLPDRAAVDALDGVLDLVPLEDLLAGLDDELAVPVVDAQHHALAGLQVPAGVEAVVVGAARHVLQVGQELVGAGDLDERRTARRANADKRRGLVPGRACRRPRARGCAVSHASSSSAPACPGARCLANR